MGNVVGTMLDLASKNGGEQRMLCDNGEVTVPLWAVESNSNFSVTNFCSSQTMQMYIMLSKFLSSFHACCVAEPGTALSPQLCCLLKSLHLEPQFLSKVLYDYISEGHFSPNLLPTFLHVLEGRCSTVSGEWVLALWTSFLPSLLSPLSLLNAFSEPGLLAHESDPPSNFQTPGWPVQPLGPSLTSHPGLALLHPGRHAAAPAMTEKDSWEKCVFWFIGLWNWFVIYKLNLEHNDVISIFANVASSLAYAAEIVLWNEIAPWRFKWDLLPQLCGSVCSGS